MLSMSSSVIATRTASSATDRPRAVRMSYRALPNASSHQKYTSAIGCAVSRLRSGLSEDFPSAKGMFLAA
jgi:hypothetical protein